MIRPWPRGRCREPGAGVRVEVLVSPSFRKAPDDISRRLPRALAITVPAVALLAATACGSGENTTATSTATEVTPVAVSSQKPGDADKGTVAANRLSVATAGRAAQAALAKCQADGLGFVTVSVVDRFGNVQAMLRGDNAAEHTSRRRRARRAIPPPRSARTPAISPDV